MIGSLPTCLQDLICAFAWNADLAQTKSALDDVLVIKSYHLQTMILSQICGDYSEAPDYIYSKQAKQCRTVFSRYTVNNYHTTPLLNFYVWFAHEELINYERVFSLLVDLDWRRIRPMVYESGYPSRIEFMRFVSENFRGVVYCSRVLNQIEPSMFRVRSMYSVAEL